MVIGKKIHQLMVGRRKIQCLSLGLKTPLTNVLVNVCVLYLARLRHYHKGTYYGYKLVRE